MKHSRMFLLILLLVVPALLLGACDSDDADDVATEVDEAAENVEDEAEDVGEDLDEAAEDAEDSAEDLISEDDQSIDDTAEDVGEDLDEAAEDVEDEAEGLVDDDDEQNAVDYLRDEEDFTTLVSLIDAAHLTTSAYVDDSMPVTIIAPTDEAFSNIMESMDMSLAEFEAEHPELVEDLLLYHSIDGDFTLDDLRDMDGETIMTTSGEELTVRVEEDGTVFIGDVEITAEDEDFDSGVILTVEEVLLPPSMSDIAMSTS